MEIRRATYEILKDVIDSMIKTVTGKTGTTWTDNLDGTFTLLTCSTLWLRPGMKVTIDGTQYQVKSVVNNKSVTVTAASAPASTEFDLPQPSFWHGTIRFVNEEVTKKSEKDGTVFPMIFLHEPTTEHHNRNRLDPEGMRSDCELYFMASNNNNWTNQDHYNIAVAAMRNMANSFMDALFSFRGVMREGDFRNDYQIEDRVRWGKAVFNGNDVELITGDLTGTSLKISPQFEKSICCCEC